MMLFLAACGYTPVYAPAPSADGGKTSPQAEFAAIYVVPMPDRIGQQLRNELLDKGFSADETGTDLVLAEMVATEFDLGLAPDNTATRRQLTLTGRMLMTRDGEALIDRTIVARTTYNVLISQYGTTVSRDSAERQVIGDLVRQIETQVALTARGLVEQEIPPPDEDEDAFDAPPPLQPFVPAQTTP